MTDPAAHTPAPALAPEQRRALEQGAALFNAGQWWEAHEAWEAAWQRARGLERDFFQALILLAAALHKRWHHGSLSARNFHKAQKYLRALPPEYAGVPLRALNDAVRQALEEPRQPQITCSASAPSERLSGKWLT